MEITKWNNGIKCRRNEMSTKWVVSRMPGLPASGIAWWRRARPRPRNNTPTRSSSCRSRLGLVANCIICEMCMLAISPNGSALLHVCKHTPICIAYKNYLAADTDGKIVVNRATEAGLHCITLAHTALTSQVWTASRGRNFPRSLTRNRTHVCAPFWKRRFLRR